ncbi:hypothetical protein [Paenibacillus sp. YAF4_2]|uniref:hypothetical protein n=1 Tax=Paenibacillus sp. YAF4_2 TaxID=3233085 RepID=UPI003F96FCC6
MTNKNNKTIKSIIISLIMILFTCWYLFESTSLDRITIVEAGNYKIVVQDRDKNRTTIETYIGISKIIKTDEVYDIKYKKRILQRPRLITITPVN